MHASPFTLLEKGRVKLDFLSLRLLFLQRKSVNACDHLAGPPRRPVSPPAVRLVLDMLIEPYLYELSDNGRVNIFVYLDSTMAHAWTPVLYQR